MAIGIGKLKTHNGMTTTKKTTKETAPAPHIDYLTIRSGNKNSDKGAPDIFFTQIMLNNLPYQSGNNNSGFFMTAFINSQNVDTKDYEAKLLFEGAYEIFTPNWLTNMKNDINEKIIAPAKTAGRVPVIVICGNQLGGSSWDASPDFIQFMHQMGAGPKLSDINQKATQLGSYDCPGIGYILVTKYDGNQYYEVFEAADTTMYPSASLSLQLVQVPVTLANGETNSYMTLQDNS